MPTAAARPTPLLLAGLLALSACTAVGQTPPTPAAAPPAPAAASTHEFPLANPPVTPDDGQAFGPPRDPARPADPARADGTVRLGVPQLAPPPGPTVVAPHPLPAALVELQHNAGHLQRCWDQRSPAVKGGSITIHAHLDPQGLVTGQCITDDTVGDPAIQRCANELIAMGRYPTFGDEPADVTFSMSVGPAAGG
jgi:hypothetical protein